MGRSPDWVTATELADHAFCPRSFYYSRHPPAGGPSPASQRRARAGMRYHQRELGRERRRASGGAAYWAVLVLGVLLVLGGAAWLLYR